MSYYGVVNGRRTGVYDNWEDCKDQVHGYSHNNYKKFDTPDKAWDFVDQHSSKGNVQFDANSKAVTYRNNNQNAIRGNYQREVSSYQYTNYMHSVTLSSIFSFSDDDFLSIYSKEERASSYAIVLRRAVGMETDVSSRNIHVLTGKIINNSTRFQKKTSTSLYTDIEDYYMKQQYEHVPKKFSL